MKKTLGQPYLKIGEVARLIGVSPSVIRTWEGLGLTRPQALRLIGAENFARQVRLLPSVRP